ncbi:hypothetical protein Tco_0978564 [Tanacetum coccineum]|uniref:Uncharacterized protein n=1 Tax=Tanacetum coccineum TaxID=301880 RepID=A0ABQ5EPE6_9ASTR
MCFYGSGDEVKSRRKIVTKDVGLADKGKGLVGKGKGIMVDERKDGRKTARSRNSGIVIGENVNPTFSEVDDSDSDIYYLRVRMSLYHLGRETMRPRKPNQSNINSSTPVAGCSRPHRVYDVGESYTVIEHKEYMEKLMHQLRDKGDCLTYPFTILENDQSYEKFPIHDEQTHWKMRKPKVGEKYVDAAQLKECLTYYSFTNGFSLWLYRSSKEMLIARCEMRPEKLKYIEKGKQRKHIKYPSGGRSDGSKYVHT